MATGSIGPGGGSGAPETGCAMDERFESIIDDSLSAPTTYGQNIALVADSEKPMRIRSIRRWQRHCDLERMRQDRAPIYNGAWRPVLNKVDRFGPEFAGRIRQLVA